MFSSTQGCQVQRNTRGKETCVQCVRWIDGVQFPVSIQGAFIGSTHVGLRCSVLLERHVLPGVSCRHRSQYSPSRPQRKTGTTQHPQVKVASFCTVPTPPRAYAERPLIAQFRPLQVRADQGLPPSLTCRERRALPDPVILSVPPRYTCIRGLDGRSGSRFHAAGGGSRRAESIRLLIQSPAWR